MFYDLCLFNGTFKVISAYVFQPFAYNLMDEAIDELKRLVFDEKRLVTAQYLLRHTALNAIEVQT